MDEGGAAASSGACPAEVGRLMLVFIGTSPPLDASLRDRARMACVCRDWRDALQGRTPLHWAGEADANGEGDADGEGGSGGGPCRQRRRTRRSAASAAGHDLVVVGRSGGFGDRFAALLSRSALLCRPGQATSLNTLELANCGLTDVGASRLATALAGVAVALEDLSVRVNAVGDAGATALAQLLVPRARVPLQALCLADNLVGEAGATALALALVQGEDADDIDGGRTGTCCLVSLDLSNNRVGDAGGEALAESVGWATRTRAGVLKLDLRGNGIGNGRRHRARLVLNAALARASEARGGEPPREAGAVGSGRRVSLVSLLV